MTTYAFLDLETTGLDPRTNSVIEIAIILLEDGAIIHEYQSFVRPHIPIPPEVTDITGITDEMVADAPTLFALRTDIRRLLGNHPIVGHNVQFDLSFLQQEQLGEANTAVDTINLASILLPRAGQYSLEYLADYLMLAIDDGGQTHRALADVLLTAELFLELSHRANQLDIGILSEIIETGSRVGWPEVIFFEDALKVAVRNSLVASKRPRRGKEFKELYKPASVEGQQLTPKEKTETIPTDLIVDMFAPTGNFAQAFVGFEQRPQQIEMVEAVAEAFNNGQHLLIEAGTGTGKSVGYLLPAAFWAEQNGRRVVISTNTINLQDQLVDKDIPALQTILPFQLRATVRKGRRNYVCTRLFQQWRHRGVNDPSEMPLYARLLVWLPTTQTGDKAEIALRSFDERLAWDKMSAENELCTGDTCKQNRCPRWMAQRRAENAHIVIVNHALLLSDLANENHILPEFKDLIVDEAHHLESAVTSGLSFEADKRSMERTLNDITRHKSGLLDELTGRTNMISPTQRDALDTLVNKVRATAELADSRVADFFTTVHFFLQDYARGGGRFAEQIRLTTAVRTQPLWDEVANSWDNLHKPLHEMVRTLGKIADATEKLTEHNEIDDVELSVQNVLTAQKGLEEMRTTLDNIIASPDDGYIYWAEIFKDRLSLHAAPLHVGPLVEEYVFHEKETVILTSATMRTAPAFGGETPTFNYIRDRLNATDADELALGSPFDYKANSLLYLVSDMPEPNQPGYQRLVEKVIVDTAVTLGGRTLVLFTSYAQLQQTAQAIRLPLQQEGVTMLAQLQGSSRQQLTAQFKNPKARAVLLGTRSFWEGVDVPGDALQAVILVKIPFDVPSDPVFAARSETFDNSFRDYSIPEAILRWRQGFGRLIRRKSDEGVVLVLDKRVLSKSYGHAFTDSLPDSTTIRQPASRVPELLVRWFNRARQ